MTTSGLLADLILLALVVAILEILAAVAEGTPVRVTVVNRAGAGVEERSIGSGTFVSTDQGPMVITCAHLFQGGARAVFVCAGDRGCAPAEILGVDSDYDLAALRIRGLDAQPAQIARQAPTRGSPLRACGFGQQGDYACQMGETIGYVRANKQTTVENLVMRGTVRQGDSGGPIYNEAGELVAVIWGTADGQIVGTCCGRIRRFLHNLLGRSPGQPPIPPQMPGRTPETPLVPVAPDQPTQNLPDLGSLIEGFDRLTQDVGALRQQGERLQGIEQQLGQVGGLKERLEQLANETAIQPDQIRAIIRDCLPTDGVPGWFAALLPTLTALGWTTPPTAGGLAALWMIAGLIRRYRGRRVKPSTEASQTSEGGSASADQTFPVGALPRDSAEAVEILRLSTLEGRDPVLDALVGRLASDELDNLVESGGPDADWAAKFRLGLRERVNRIMPVAISVARPNA